MDSIVVLTHDQLTEVARLAASHAVTDLWQAFTAPTPEIMTKAEVAKYLRCDVSKINRFMRTGMPHFTFGSTPRFRKAEIDRWLEST